MNKEWPSERFWSFIGENLISLATVAAGIIAVIAQQLNWISGPVVSSTILGLLCLLATSEIVERARKLDRLEYLIVESSEKAIKSLSGVEATLLPTSEAAFNYMANRIELAQKRIDHAALAPAIPRERSSARRWEQAIAKVLKADRVLYRYIASFADPYRLDRVRQHLADPAIKKYYVRHFDTSPSDNGSVPMLSFLIIDDEELIMHYPYSPGQPEEFLAVKHPDIIRLFSAYYECLWQEARRVDADGVP
jgi:hypothetical protein